MYALQAVGEEIAAAGCSLLLIVVSPAIVGSILVRHGTEAQRERWLPGIAAGTTRVAFAITEPDAGTNSHNLSTAATRDGGAYRLRGTKTYISGVEDAHAILVVARKREADGSLGLPLLMLVDTDAPGLERQLIPVAVRASDKQWQLYFDDVEVPADRVDRRVRDGRAEGGLRRAQPGADHGRRGRQRRRPAGARARRRLRARAGRLVAADRRPPGDLPPARPGEDRARAGAADDPEGGGALRRRRPAGEAANMAKYAAAEAAIHCVDQAIQTHGGNGFALEYGLTDMYWGARLDPHRPGLARDDPQLRRRALPGAASLVLTGEMNDSRDPRPPSPSARRWPPARSRGCGSDDDEPTPAPRRRATTGGADDDRSSPQGGY